MIKTYVARGLLEYRMTLRTGGAAIRICFSGGSMGSNGVISAQYVTDNPAIQAMLENSEQFRNGRIMLLSSRCKRESKR